MPKRKKPSKFNRVTEKLSLAMAVLVIGYMGGKEVLIRTNDYLFRTQKEIKLEKRIKKQLYFNLLERGEERQHKLNIFKYSYENMQHYWDNFEKQFAQASRVFVYYTVSWGRRYNGRITAMRELKINSGGETLPHELAHLWHMNKAPSEFNKKWEEITGNHYVFNYRKATLEDMITNGAVSKYALRNLLEDVADTAKLVYQLNHPNIMIRGFPNKKPTYRRKKYNYEEHTSKNIRKPAIPKIMDKVRLLREYDFISQRESEHALKELEGFDPENKF